MAFNPIYSTGGSLDKIKEIQSGIIDVLKELQGGMLNQVELIDEILKITEVEKVTTVETVNTINEINNIKAGTLDRVVVIDKIKEIETINGFSVDVDFPNHIIPSYTRPYTKGFRMVIPPIAGKYEATYQATSNLELIDVAIACSGYNGDDYWNLLVNDTLLFDSIYTKEIPQHINMGTTLFTVYKVSPNDIIKLEFYNEGAEAKTVWFDLRFLIEV